MGNLLIRWSDGYVEDFEAVEASIANVLLFVTLVGGCRIRIPLCAVIWHSGYSQELVATEIRYNGIILWGRMLS